MSRLSDIMTATGMTREQIRRAVATAYGSFNPDTYARLASEADHRLANLYNAMRGVRQYLPPEKIDTAEKARKLRLLIQKNSPVESGALKRSWSNPNTVQFTETGVTTIDNPLPYARIQDLGGTIHRVSSRGKSYTIVIPAQHYVGKAIMEYNATETELPITQANMASTGMPSIAALVRAGVSILRQQQGAG